MPMAAKKLFSLEAELFISMGSGVREDFLGGGVAKEILTSILVGMVRSYIITCTLFREK